MAIVTVHDLSPRVGNRASGHRRAPCGCAQGIRAAAQVHMRSGARSMRIIAALALMAAPLPAVAGPQSPAGPQSNAGAQAPAAQSPAPQQRMAPPSPLVQLAPIDLTKVPEACKPLAKQALGQSMTAALSARVSLASCMADRAIAPLALCDCGES